MSIKLTLNNFKKYENKTTFTIPSHGLILLQGPSGIGKTSILDAIYFVLYGIGSKIINFNCSNCSVIWEDDNLFISRSKKPNKLVIKQHNNSSFDYQDAVAQEIINQIYGCHFEITSYIKYKASSSFFSLSSSARMDFLQKIAIKGTDVHTLKIKTKEAIKIRKEKLISIVAEINVVQKEFDNLSLPDEVLFPFGKYNEVKIKNHKIGMKNLKVKLSNSEKVLKLTLKKQKYYDLTYQQNLFIKQRINNYIEELDNLHAELQSLKFQDITDLENMLLILQENQKYIDHNTIIKNLQKQLQDCKIAEDEQKLTELKRLQDIPIIEDKTNYYKYNLQIKKEIINTQNRLENNQEKYKELQNIDISVIDNLTIQLNNSYGKKLNCPNCNCDLLLLNDKLQKYIENSSDNTLIIKSNIQTLREQLKYKDLIFNSIEADTKFLNEHKEFDIIPDYQEILNSHLKQIKIQEQIQSEIVMLKNSSYSQSVKILEKQIQQYNTELYKLKFVDNDMPYKDIPKLQQKITTQETINSTINNIKIKINNLHIRIKEEEIKLIELSGENFTDKINSIEQQINNYKLQISQCQIQDDQLVKYISFAEKRDYYNKWKIKLQNLQLSEKNFFTSLKIAENFLTILNSTESKAVLNIINTLNIHLKFYSEQFFSEPMCIQVQPFKENQNGNIKPSVVIKIIYKGIEYDIDCLSGGETSRVELAICLAINNIINGKILLLDEVLGTLNSEYIETITNILKEEASRDNKLILTILHGASEGNFDDVINV